MPEPRNLLAAEPSPYLRQHADNPVHWRPWGPAALAEAAAAGKPILLSIGYAACHWCHVMAHESFENEETAALMNRLFVNIKVDREERPDIDHIYMTALHAMGEQGGWPLTMALTPEGRPFWGGTYFPPESRWGRPSFRQVLTALHKAWTEDRGRVEQSSGALAQALAAQAEARPGGVPGPALLERARMRLLRGMDRENGGLGTAPKFPNAPLFRFLWQEAHRGRDAASAGAVRQLLVSMSQGGIYDHLGGGYARYATDAVWLVPHFEKMLYDNALILELLAFAHAAAPDPLFAARAAETIGWLARDMRAGADGAVFAASEDADSEGVEGKFYVWSRAEIETVLGPDFAFFERHYDLPAEGNWEGHIILRRTTRPGDAAGEQALQALRARLLAARAARIRPGRDDKVLADWNGLAIAALARAAASFGEPAWLALAARAHAALTATHRGADGRLAHAWLGRVTAAGLIEDQGAMLRAGLALAESHGLFSADGRQALADAEALATAAVAAFGDGDGGFFIAAADAADLPAGAAFRARNPVDGPTPSGIGLMAEGFARLWHLTGAEGWRARAEAALASFGGLGDGLASCPTLLAAADLLEEATSVVIVGDPASPRFRALHAAALAASDPAAVVLAVGDAAALPPAHPAHGKTADGEASAYLCRAGVCGLPVGAAEEVKRGLRRIEV